MWEKAHPERTKECRRKASLKRAAKKCKHLKKPACVDPTHIEKGKRGICKACARIRHIAWRKLHIKQTNEQAKLRSKLHREENRIRKMEWRHINPEKATAMIARRRSKKIKATPKWVNDFFIKEIYHLAAIRTRMLGFKWHVDHVVPLQSKSVCGLHVHNNLQVIPASQNQSKGNRSWPDMWDN